jgi:hypothetical protein
MKEIAVLMWWRRGRMMVAVARPLCIVIIINIFNILQLSKLPSSSYGSVKVLHEMAVRQTDEEFVVDIVDATRHWTP